jgi:signal transduction histidine kinase
MGIARALRYVGYALVFVAGEPLWIQPLCWDEAFLGSPRFPLWVAAYAVFALAFHVGASSAETARTRRLVALAVMTPAMLAMSALLACEFGALGLVVVASQAALVLSPRQTAALVVAQTAVLGACLASSLVWVHAVSHVIGLAAAQSFAIVSVVLARRSADAARELAHANAELRATRALLEDTTRSDERIRISRELHDVLGHDLAALGLQLEVATHVPPDRASAHIATAREVSARLLRDVREVVASMRAAPPPDLAAALRALAAEIPGMTIHLEIPDELRVDDTARSHCILRCVQEIITNAVKHSHATNLWIAIAVADGATTLDARDDGRGAAEVQVGQGLSGMRARLEEMGGWLRIASEPTHAFAVSAWLPPS